MSKLPFVYKCPGRIIGGEEPIKDFYKIGGDVYHQVTVYYLEEPDREPENMSWKDLRILASKYKVYLPLQPTLLFL